MLFFNYGIEKNSEGRYFIKRDGYIMRCPYDTHRNECGSWCPKLDIKIQGGNKYIITIGCAGVANKYEVVDNNL